MRKIFLLIAACCMSMPLMAGNITIAIVPKGTDNPIFDATRIAAEKEAKELGVNLIWRGSPTADPVQQALIVEGLIKDKVQGIAISCTDAGVLKNVINKAVESGIVVSTWDSDAPNSKRMLYVGTDNYRGGAECGKEMVMLIGRDKNVIALSGDPGAFNLRERIRGFEETVKDLNINIIVTLYCFDDVEKSALLLEEYLKSNPKVDGVFMAGGWPLWRGVEKMPNLRAFKGGVVCLDYFSAAKPFIEQGMIDVCLGQDFSNMGKLSVRYLVDAINKKEISSQNIDSGLYRVDKANVDKY
jgi:ribose transport system substrate-binding protein